MDKEKQPESCAARNDSNMHSDEEDTIHYVGDKNAIIFSVDSNEPVPSVELPDDFFELSKEDVKLLFKEMKQQRDDLENMPLQTRSVREMESSAASLSRLRHYTRTVLRIQFPDRLVLQAVFNHSDTVQTVVQFLRHFLDPPDVQFYLYTAPPKCVLDTGKTLLDSKLTPRALLYFGTSPQEERTTFIKSSLTSTLTLPKLASQAALQFRREEVEEVKQEKPVESERAGPSTSQNTSKASSKRPASTNTKVPKWFRP